MLYDRKVGKGIYKLGRVLTAKPDCNGIVRTVTVGVRRSDVREPADTYVPKGLQEITLGVQRVAVLCPVEEQGDKVPGSNVVGGADG